MDDLGGPPHFWKHPYNSKERAERCCLEMTHDGQKKKKDAFFCIKIAHLPSHGSCHWMMENPMVKKYVPWSRLSRFIGDKLIPPLIGILGILIMGPYKPLITDLGWWVYPLLYGNNGSLDPIAHIHFHWPTICPVNLFNPGNPTSHTGCTRFGMRTSLFLAVRKDRRNWIDQQIGSTCPECLPKKNDTWICFPQSQSFSRLAPPHPLQKQAMRSMRTCAFSGLGLSFLKWTISMRVSYGRTWPYIILISERKSTSGENQQRGLKWLEKCWCTMYPPIPE